MIKTCPPDEHDWHSCDIHGKHKTQHRHGIGEELPETADCSGGEHNDKIHVGKTDYDDGTVAVETDKEKKEETPTPGDTPKEDPP